MKNSDRFKSISNIAISRESSAALAVSHAQMDVQQKQSRLDQLNIFYQEYVQQFERQGKSGFVSQELQSYRSFLEDLRKAIDQQNTLVDIAQRLLNEKRILWFEARKKVKVYEKVISNYLQEERYKEDKKDQSLMDEYAQNITRRK